jgi:hypothetical protein
MTDRGYSIPASILEGPVEVSAPVNPTMARRGIDEAVLVRLITDATIDYRVHEDVVKRGLSQFIAGRVKGFIGLTMAPKP